MGAGQSGLCRTVPQKARELNAPDFATLFGGGAKGYIDYPALA